MSNRNAISEASSASHRDRNALSQATDFYAGEIAESLKHLAAPVEAIAREQD